MILKKSKLIVALAASLVMGTGAMAQQEDIHLVQPFFYGGYNFIGSADEICEQLAQRLNWKYLQVHKLGTPYAGGVYSQLGCRMSFIQGNGNEYILSEDSSGGNVRCVTPNQVDSILPAGKIYTDRPEGCYAPASLLPDPDQN